MPPCQRIAAHEHEWTTFEKHTLLCLMAKNMHLEEKGNRNEERDGIMRQHAYMNVATALNSTLNGIRGNFENDIDHREVAKMIDRMLKEKKGVVGKGGYMERATQGRITRGLKRMWAREPGFNYNGTKGEWDQWRKKSEEEKRRGAAGGAPSLNPDVVVRSVETETRDIVGDIWRLAGAGLTIPVNNPTRTPVIGNIAVQRQDSFHSLPAHLRTDERFAWANRGVASASRPSDLDASATIDSYRPSYVSTRPQQSSSSAARFQQGRDNYRPEPMSTPALTNAYSSSPSKGSTYSGTTRPTTTIRNPYQNRSLARNIENEWPNRCSDRFKKPGILKHTSNVGNPGDRTPGYQTPGYQTPGARTPGYTVNAAREATFVVPNLDLETGEVLEERSSSLGGQGAYQRDPLFNDLGQLRGSEADTEMQEY